MGLLSHFNYMVLNFFCCLYVDGEMQAAAPGVFWRTQLENFSLFFEFKKSLVFRIQPLC